MKTPGDDPLLRAKNLLIMEDTSIVQNGAQLGLQGPTTNTKQNEESSTKAQYSIPGILHFIQHEWARFELERSQWEVDRAELQVQIIKQMCFILLFTCHYSRQESLSCKGSEKDRKI